MENQGMNLTSPHLFQQIEKPPLPRSQLLKPFRHKTTFDEAYLIPVMWDEVLPGDTYNVQASMMCRLSTPIVPVMDDIFMDVFYWFIPRRLTWEHWENFMGANIPDYNSSTDFLEPVTTAPAMGGVATGDLADYLGVPIKVDSLEFDSCLMRSYLLVWDDFYRDENLQSQVLPTVGTGDGPDTYTDFPLLKRGKRHDYFTSCLPWPQKGPSVTLPIGDYAPVGNLGYFDTDGNAYMYQDFVTAGVTPLYNGTTYGPLMPNNPATGAPDWFVAHAGTGLFLDGVTGFVSNDAGAALEDGGTADVIKLAVPFGGLTADLSTAVAATVNQLRQAFAIQKLYERDARGGTRYVELLLSHFGVVSPDFRLQRPEYLGGITQKLVINPVVQTSGSGISDQDTPQGNLAAFGVLHSMNGFTKSFVEHGYIMCMVSVRSAMTYQQGLVRGLSRQTRLDHYWPALAHIGEQAVLQKEIYCEGNANDNIVFGYQGRYDEYRYMPNQISGQFRSTATDPLDIWHLGFDFSGAPVLNATFIEEAPPIGRIVAVEDEPHFIFDSVFNINVARQMPTYGTPGQLDRL